MRISLSALFRTSLFLLIFLGVETACSFLTGKGFEKNAESENHHSFIHVTKTPQDSIQVLVGTFLGNESHNYYGDSVGNKLDIIWKTFLGKGTTIVTAEKGVEEWFGAGWTGQPLVVKEYNKTYLIQGAFDHHLKKIDAATGEVIWNYEYDDILKGTGTIWKNDSAKNPLDRIVIMQGSRKGVQFSMSSPYVSSFRAVSFFTGKELWRMNVAHTECYSRDCDASPLVRNDTAYIGLENGKFVRFDPGKIVTKDDTVNRPRIFSETMLYSEADHAHHGGNLVTESSPARIGDHIYVTAGSGHVYGYNMHTHEMDWDFYIGSDLDGSPVVTSDSCLLVEVEKQYISGHGGVFKLNPRRASENCVDWYFPTGDLHFSDWEGGVIGSVSVNDSYNDGSFPHLAAFTGIDGILNVVCYDKINSDSLVNGPDGKTKYPSPVLKFRTHIGSSISTPIFAQNKLIAAGYHGINLFEFDKTGNFTLEDNWEGNFEASPVADHGRIYIASRDGFLYCFGDTTKGCADLPSQKELRQTSMLMCKSADDTSLKVNVIDKKGIVYQPKAKKGFPFLLTLDSLKKVAHKALAKNGFPFSLHLEPKEKIEPTIVAAVVPEKKEVVPPVQISNDTLAHFHLIAGVFKSKENADRNLKLWRDRGMNAVLFVSPKGMNYISIAQGSTAEELGNEMQKVKQAYNCDAWVFERK
jgi:outer membrane protein assembly factor BamB